MHDSFRHKQSEFELKREFNNLIISIEWKGKLFRKILVSSTYNSTACLERSCKVLGLDIILAGLCLLFWGLILLDSVQIIIVKVVVSVRLNFKQSLKNSLFLSWKEAFRYVDLVFWESRETNIPRGHVLKMFSPSEKLLLLISSHKFDKYFWLSQSGSLADVEESDHITFDNFVFNINLNW